MLENKLANLQRLLSDSQAATDSNMQAFAQEDKLLSRLETLENQLETLTMVSNNCCDCFFLLELILHSWVIHLCIVHL